MPPNRPRTPDFFLSGGEKEEIPLNPPKAELAKFYSLASGIETSEDELMKIGERIHTVEKMFNVYHAGFTRKDYYPPRRLMEEPIRSGPLRGELLRRKDWNGMLDEYYRLHGWNQYTSWPTEEKLHELGLHECIGRLEQAKRKHRPNKRRNTDDTREV